MIKAKETDPKRAARLKCETGHDETGQICEREPVVVCTPRRAFVAHFSRPGLRERVTGTLA